jgi:predicted Rossmann-fold nucleotide-binding protein
MYCAGFDADAGVAFVKRIVDASLNHLCVQTGKIDHPTLLPVVLFGEKYWRTVVNWDALVEHGVINQVRHKTPLFRCLKLIVAYSDRVQSDVDRLFFTDSAQAAFEHVTKYLVQWEAAAAASALAAAEVMAPLTLCIR